MQSRTAKFETYFKEYLDRGIAGGAPWKQWNYKDDITVLGTYDLFCATGDLFYRDAIFQITEGKLLADDAPCPYNLDMISAAKTDMVLERLTGEERYQKRFQRRMQLFEKYPRTKTGNFWHKDIYPNQVWLDGLYMAMPVYLQDPSNAVDAMRQFESVRDILYVPETGLYVHAWDEDRVQEWADPVTGLSPNVWLRALGWYLMSLADCYSLMPLPEQANRLAELLKEGLSALMKYQDTRTKMFYQLADLPEQPGNYPETSGSAMVAYSLMKGSRLGMLEEACFSQGAEILEGIAKTYLENQDGTWVLGGICGSAGLGAGPDNRTDRDGSVSYYLSEAIKPDNQHGTAACMMAYSEFLYGSDGRR